MDAQRKGSGGASGCCHGEEAGSAAGEGRGEEAGKGVDQGLEQEEAAPGACSAPLPPPLEPDFSGRGEGEDEGEGEGEGEGEKSMEEATTHVFELYRSIFHLLHSDHLLFSTRYLLMGFVKCVEVGPNPDDVPNYKVHVDDSYYEWAYWKEATLLLNKAKAGKPKFRFEAMLEYIRRAHAYLARVRGSAAGESGKD